MIIKTPQQKLDQETPYKIRLLSESDIGPNLKEFLTKPCPKGYLIQCTVLRKKVGFGWMYPKYNIFLSNGKKYLMSAKKKSLNKTSNYVMSLSQDNFNIASDYALGKVRSNFMGTEFKIYDNGQNPRKCQQWDKVRSEIGVILYESNMLGNKGPRRMKVLTPEVKSNGQSVKFKPLKKEEGILQCYKSGKKEGITHYINKVPKWNEQAQAFVLNFHGRVDKASVKNFQLVDNNDDEDIYMQFGRIANQQFNLDFQYPLSMVQAVGIALSSFDYKIACE